MTSIDIKYHYHIADYFKAKSLYLDEQNKGKPNVRKIIEQPYQETKAEMWDEMVETLCDLYFIEAKCAAGLTFVLIDDYHHALDNLPERQAEVAEDKRRKERIDRWTREIIEYSRKWSDRRDRKRKLNNMRFLNDDAYPQLPEPPPSCRIWSQEEIDAECTRIINNPTQFDILSAYAKFAISESYSLSQYSSIPGFVIQHAFNSASNGTVHGAAHNILNTISVPLLLQHKNSEYNPKRAVMTVLEGQIQGISCVCVAADGMRAISSSWDRITPIRMWDLENGKCLFTLQGHEIEVEGTIMTPDGRLGVSVCRDRTLRVWDLYNQSCNKILTGHTREVDCVCMTPDGQLAVSGSHDQTIRVWDLETGECLHLLEGHKSAVCCVSITPDGLRAISGGHDNAVYVWDLEKGKCITILQGHTSTVTGVCISLDGHIAVSGGWDNSVRVWDIESGNCLRILTGHTQAIRSVAMTVDGHLGVSGSGGGGYPQDFTVRAWNLQTGDCLRILDEHSEMVNTVSITPDGRRVLSGSSDSTIRVWDLESGQNKQTLKEHKEWINNLYITPDGKRVFSSSKDNTFRIWDMDKKTCLSTIEKVANPVITPDLCRIVGGSSDGTATLRVWDIEKGTCLRELKGGKYSAPCLSVTKDGNHVAAGIGDGTVQLWNLASGQCVHEMKVHSQGVSCLSLLPDGHSTISGSADASLKVWDMERGECINNLVGHSLRINSVAVTPDGSLAVSGGHGMDSAIRVWDLKTGSCLHTLVGHTSGVTSLCITPDGKRAISASKGGNWEVGTGDNRIFVWDIENGRCLHTLTGHSLAVNSLALCFEGCFIVSGSWDKTVRIWDIKEGRCIAFFRAPFAISAVSMTTSMDSIVCGTRSGEIIFLELHNNEFTIS
jgi:WD40 repeat protein